MKHLGKARTHLARVLALTLTVLSVLFLLQVASHAHQKGQNEATCQVCQAAHGGSGQVIRTPSVIAPFPVGERIQPFIPAFHQELFYHDSPSPAPPAA